METTITRIGNSAGVRIPSAILKACRMKNGDKVKIITEGRKIILVLENPFAELDALMCDDGRDALEIAAELRNTRVNDREIDF